MNRSRMAVPQSAQRISARFQSLAAQPWFAYVTLALLQLKLFWNVWQYRDLTYGDTSSYFVSAVRWYQHFRTNVDYSPLYTVFYGSLMHLWQDAYAVTIAHRVIIALIASLLVLALMRRLLPSPLSWIIAAWWVILPTNYDSLYEVHIFSVIPPLVAFLIAAYRPGMVTRGLALGVFVFTTILVRNEFALSAALWVVFCVVYEVWHARKVGASRWTRYLAAYGLPLLLVGIVVVLFYVRAVTKFPELSRALTVKHTLNVCQIYAFNYQQRFTDWTLSPWTQCSDLMQKTFGSPYPSMIEAIRANPSAMLDYFLWNVRLIPDGLQVLLFGATGGSGQPDYIPVTTGASYASVFGIALLIVIVAGLVALWRDRRRLTETWLQGRSFGWLALLTSVPVAVVVIVMQRPRPEYLYTLSVFLMALTGLCLVELFGRTIAGEAFKRGVAVGIVLLLIVIPSRFAFGYQTANGAPGRPLMERYERLAPFQSVIAQPGGVLLSAGYGGELCSYLGLNNCTGANYYDFRSEPDSEAFASWLDRMKITVAYLDKTVLADTRVQAFAQALDNSHWKTVAFVDDGHDRWMLLQRQGAVPETTTLPPDSAAPSSLRAFPEDLRKSELKAAGIYDDGWTGSKASFCLTQPDEQSRFVLRAVLPAIDNPDYTTQLTISLDGHEALRQTLKTGNVEIPVSSAKAGEHCVQLVFSSTQVLPNGDGRQAGVLLRFAGFEPLAAAAETTATSAAPTEAVTETAEATATRPAFTEAMTDAAATAPAEVLSASSLRVFPDDLKQPGVEAAGIYNDGWTSDDARVCLMQPEDQTRLVIRGLVPRIDNPAYQTDLTVSVDGRQMLKQTLALGYFEIPVSMTSSGRHCLELAFSATQVLPNGDGRHAGALLRFLGFESTSPTAEATSDVPPPESISHFPDDLKLPGVNAVGIYNDGWTSNRAALCLTQPSDHLALVVHGMVPLIDTQSYTTDITVQMDGQTVIQQTLRLGVFQLTASSSTAGGHCVQLSFSRAQVLPRGDGRQVGALLRLIGFEPLPTPTPTAQ